MPAGQGVASPDDELPDRIIESVAFVTVHLAIS